MALLPGRVRDGTRRFVGTSTPAAPIVRIAVDTASEVGNRTVQALLGERSVEYVGVLSVGTPRRKRSGPLTTLDGYDVVVSDGTSDIHVLAGRASVAGLPLVLWRDSEGHLDAPSHTPIINGANVASALTAALATHPAAATHPGDVVRIGWTEPGTPLKRGEPLPFPDPVGTIWTKKRGPGRFVGFRNDEWGGAVVDIDGPSGRRIVGVADHGAYLEAITLAAVALLAGEGVYDCRSQRAAARPERLLDKVYELELEVAVWRSPQES